MWHQQVAMVSDHLHMKCKLGFVIFLFNSKVQVLDTDFVKHERV